MDAIIEYWPVPVLLLLMLASRWMSIKATSIRVHILRTQAKERKDLKAMEAGVEGRVQDLVNVLGGRQNGEVANILREAKAPDLQLLSLHDLKLRRDKQQYEDAQQKHKKRKGRRVRAD
eukprot:Hpha_TRINITY_DN16801_c4_g8::TRINITY_DN16801_c4_g8_i1::g.149596::m.149596